jgi:hypothetical protein
VKDKEQCRFWTGLAWGGISSAMSETT